MVIPEVMGDNSWYTVCGSSEGHQAFFRKH